MCSAALRKEPAIVQNEESKLHPYRKRILKVDAMKGQNGRLVDTYVVFFILRQHNFTKDTTIERKLFCTPSSWQLCLHAVKANDSKFSLRP